jgi:hypothetical protein
MASNILVLGAGELGTAILTALTKTIPSSTRLTVLLRPSTVASSSTPKYTSLFTFLNTNNISAFPGDISTLSIPELATLFTPYDLVICALGFASGSGSQIKITKAVLQAKVKRYVPWQFGVDYDVVGRGSVQPVWDEQLDVRELLRGEENMNTEWIIVSTGIFMSFLFEKSFGVVDLEYVMERAEGGEAEGDIGDLRALGSWGTEVTVTTAEDIGKLTAGILFEEPRRKNEVVYVAGQTISYGGLGTILDNVLERRLRKVLWSVEDLKEELRKDPENVLKRYRVVFAEGKGVAWDMTRTWSKEKNVEVIDVETYARKLYGKGNVMSDKEQSDDAQKNF